MSAQGITGALLAGLSAVNDQKAWENQTAKDKVAYDNTRSSTALNRQSFDHKALNNPFVLRASELANEMNQQTLDQNALMYPLNVTGKELTNTGVGYDNTKKFNENSSFKAFMDNPLNNAQTLNNYQGTYGNARHNPTNANKLNMGQTLIDIATGGGQPVTHQGKQYEGQEQLDALQTAISSLMSSGKGGTTKPTFVYSYDELGNKIATYNYDPSTNAGTQINLNGVAQKMPDGTAPLPIGDVLKSAMSSNFGTSEFNETANRADFNVKANEVYQAFLRQTNDPAQAQAMTQEFMFKQLDLDGDNESWLGGLFYDKELDYTPNNQSVTPQSQLPIVSNDAEYMALPAGATFIDPQGNVRTKAE